MTRPTAPQLCADAATRTLSRAQFLRRIKAAFYALEGVAATRFDAPANAKATCEACAPDLRSIATYCRTWNLPRHLEMVQAAQAVCADTIAYANRVTHPETSPDE